MNQPLYTTAILRLAASSGDHPSLDHADASVSARTPVCGSHITMDVTICDNVISAIGYGIHACAFGQASAALFAGGAVGQTAGQVADAARDLARWLSGELCDPPLWPGIDALAPARDRVARHAAITMPFTAGAKAAQLALDAVVP